MTVCGWVNRRQLAAIEYLREENRVLREQLGPKRLVFSARQRADSEGLGAGKRQW